MIRKRLDKVINSLAFYAHMSVEERYSHQLRQLQTSMRHHYNGNATYRQLCHDRGVSPDDIQTLEEIQHLPIVERDFLKKYSFCQGEGGALSVPFSDLTTYLNIPGSKARSEIIPVAESDMDSIFENVALALWMSGIRGYATSPCGTILPIFPQGSWASTFYSQNGCEIIGFSPRVDQKFPYELHLQNLKDFRPKYIHTSPSFISAFANYLEGQLDFFELQLDRIVLAADFFSENFREEIEERFGARVLDLYGCAETQVVSIETDDLYERYRGLMYHLAHMSIIEVVEPGTENLLPLGEKGEMVITVFNQRAWPLVRYRTGELITLCPYESPLPGCEYTFPLMSRIRSHVDEK